MDVAKTSLVVVEILAASVWIGSLVCLAVVTSAARRVLDDRSQVVLFRAVGRRYGSLGTISLLVGIGAGLALAWPPSAWSRTIDAAVILAGFLVLATGAGMGQARAMTGLRRRLVSTPDDAGARRAVHQGRQLAMALRGLMALVTLVIVVLVGAAISA